MKKSAVALLLFCFALMNSHAGDTSLYSLQVKTLEGEPKNLADYKGKVVLVVNVASKCGFTKQYPDLEKLYNDYKDKGFFILGFPSNDFGGQEPGSPEQIRKFCTEKYVVTFPLFEKVVTKPGEGQSPVYAFLSQTQPPPKWNFTKYLVDKEGHVITSFPSPITPGDPALRAAIDKALN